MIRTKNLLNSIFYRLVILTHVHGQKEIYFLSLTAGLITLHLVKLKLTGGGGGCI